MHAIRNLVLLYSTCDSDDLYKAVIKKILNNLDVLVDKSIYEWADICYTSATTISRLSRKLGYQNFASFKSSLKTAYKDYLNSEKTAFNKSQSTEEYITEFLEEYITASNQFIKGFNYSKIIELTAIIHSYKNIRFYPDIVINKVINFQQTLLMDGKDVCTINLPTEQLKKAKELNENTLVVLLMSRINENDLIEINERIFEEVKKKKAKMLLLCDSLDSKYLNMADYKYAFNGNQHAYNYVQYDMLIDSLTNAYMRTYAHQMKSNLLT